MATSATTDVLDLIAAAAAAESPLWGGVVRPVPKRTPVFGHLAPDRFTLGIETIYEGYLVHFGRSRLFASEDEDVALLLGDYLYAHGLVHITATGDLDAVTALAELISTCAALRAEDRPGDGDAWLGCVRRLGGDPDESAVERALALHADRLGKLAP